MERIDLNELVENSELELTTISTTSASNGYPSDVQTAIIGFNDFDEAEKFAKENKLDIIMVKSRDGWDLWSRGGTAYKEFQRTENEFGADYLGYYPKDFDAQEFFADTIKDVVSDTETLDDAIECLNHFKELIDAIESADDDEFVVSNGYEFETIKSHCMQYSCNTHKYAIAVIRP